MWRQTYENYDLNDWYEWAIEMRSELSERRTNVCRMKNWHKRNFSSSMNHHCYVGSIHSPITQNQSMSRCNKSVKKRHWYGHRLTLKPVRFGRLRTVCVCYTWLKTIHTSKYSKISIRNRQKTLAELEQLGPKLSILNCDAKSFSIRHCRRFTVYRRIDNDTQLLYGSSDQCA